MKLVAAALAAAAALAGASTARSSGIPPFCSGAHLAGTFRPVPGSAGAGNIVYKLSVRNTGTTACSLTGLPSVKLYGRTGKLLPTHITPAFRPGLTAILVRLRPGMWAHATARFSPDVPGKGEPTVGRQCEPTAYTLRVYGRNVGVAKVPIKPATPVCSHGALQLSAYTFGK